MELKEILSAEQAQVELDKLNARQNELKDQIEKRGAEFQEVNTEERDSFLNATQALKDEFDANADQIAKLEERKEKLEQEARKMSIVNHEPQKQEKRYGVDTVEYRDLWIKTIKGEMSPAELRAVTSSADGVPVPTIMQQYVETAWERYGHVSALVTKSYYKGLLAVPYEESATDAAYHTEGGAAATEETLTLDETLLQPVMIKKWISVTDEVKALTGDEFLRYIADEIVYKVVKFLDDQIVAGAGSSSKGVIGITSAALTESMTAALDFNVINVALGSLGDRVENPVAIMNKKTFYANFMGLKDTSGQPIFRVLTDNEGRTRNYVNGIPVVFSSALDDYGTATASTDPYLIVGDLSAYRLNLPEGEDVIMLHDPYTLATQDMERIIGRLFAAGNVVRPNSLIKVIKAAAE